MKLYPLKSWSTLITILLALECCMAVPVVHRYKRQAPDFTGIATQVAVQAAATAMEAIQNGAAAKHSFSIQGPGKFTAKI